MADAAARLALLSLRGSIHSSVKLRLNAYALASAPKVILTAEDLAPVLQKEPKPLCCRATAWKGVVRIWLDASREGTSGWLAWHVEAQRLERGELSFDVEALAAGAGRRAIDVPVLCAAREEMLLVSLADVQRWHREYAIVHGGYGFDRPENPLAKELPAYREARNRGASYVLRLG